ncbi:urea carboxylase-associated family protein [soil metagenome]
MAEASSSEIIGPGGSWSGIVRRGAILTITDLEGRQGVDFLCYSRENPEERYHAANTIKKAATLRLTSGHVLYSDVARPLMTIVEDSCGWNDTVAGCCSVPSNQMLYAAQSSAGCRENFLKELGRHNLGRKDIVANLNFFCRVPVGADNELAPQTFVEAPSKAGDRIALRAEMDVLALVSNCPQINNPCSGGKPTAIKVEISS